VDDDVGGLLRCSLHPPTPSSFIKNNFALRLALENVSAVVMLLLVE